MIVVLVTFAFRECFQLLLSLLSQNQMHYYNIELSSSRQVGIQDFNQVTHKSFQDVRSRADRNAESLVNVLHLPPDVFLHPNKTAAANSGSG